MPCQLDDDPFGTFFIRGKLRIGRCVANERHYRFFADPRRQKRYRTYIALLLTLVQLVICSTADLYAEVSAEDSSLFFSRLRPDSESDNERGGLAWAEANRLEALIDMFLATGDVSCLREARRRCESIFAKRDDLVSRRDEIRGRILPGWGSRSYSKGQWHVWVVHTGMIVYPAASLCTIVRGNLDLQEEFGSFVDKALPFLRQAIEAFELEWIETADRGFFIFPPTSHGELPSGPLPYNMTLAIGAAMIQLDRASGTHDYNAKVKKMAMFFLDGVTIDEQGRAEWRYSPDGRPEDISHGAIDIRFIVDAFEMGIAFSEEDLRAFMSAALALVEGDQVLSHIAGALGSVAKPSSARWFFMWMELCRFFPEHFAFFETLWNGNSAHYSSVGHAKLLKWKCRLGNARG